MILAGGENSGNTAVQFYSPSAEEEEAGGFMQLTDQPVYLVTKMSVDSDLERHSSLTSVLHTHTHMYMYLHTQVPR